ncbi:MAG TPA: proton-conducting transporter membrane subunit [Ignavibacteriaceae bacterium]|nr:proton-conducting transporter membrane subunit [Ignavibacteriaceae bacterium]
MIINELLLFLIVPLAVGFVNLFLPAFLRKVLTFLALAFGLVMVYLFYQRPMDSFAYFNQIIFSLDQLGLFVVTFIQILSFIILVFSLNGLDKNSEKRFFFLYPITVSFCNAVVLSEHALSFLIFWGLSGLTLYLFATMGKTLDAPKAAKKTFIIIGGSDAFLLMGLVLMWLLSPATGWSLNNPQIPLQGEFAHVAFIFLLIAAFAKAGAFPLHTWVPDFSQNSPVESAAFLPASLDKLLGIFLLAKILTSLFIVYPLINMILISLGALTVISAVMMAMVQHNGYRLLGYHAVSQVGYMVMGVASGSVLAFAGGLFHLINNALYKSSLFLTLGSVQKKAGTAELDYLGGLGKNMPITFLMALIGALSISGIPPFNGFFSKWMIYQGLIEKTSTLGPGYQLWLLACIIIAVFGSALTLASFMKFLHAAFLGRRPDIYKDVKEAPVNQWLSTGALSLLCIVFGILAVALPLKYFIYPVVEASGMSIPSFAGLYDPIIIILLFAVAFIIGLLIYGLTAKVRYDEVYVGGMPGLEKFRIAGTEFYNEVRNFTLLKSIYNYAEKKYFDLYEMGREFTFSFSGYLQKAHPGQLQLYVLYIVVGFLIIMLVV